MKNKIDICRNKDGFIDLNKLKNYREKGISVEGSNAKVWFNVNGKRFLFKEYDSILPCFGEVLYYKAAKMCGIDCAVYDFAEYEGKFGTISYDFLKKNEAYYNFLELTSQFGDTNFDLENISTNYDLLVIQNNKYNNLSSIKSMLNNLFRASSENKVCIENKLIDMFCLDTLFWHLDRTLWNYGVIVNEETDNVSFAPLHDNSHILCLNKGESYIVEMIENFINGGIMETPHSKCSSFELDFDEDDSIEQLIEFYSNSNEETRERIERIVKSLNVTELLWDVKKCCKIGDVPSLWIKAVLNFRKKTILRGLESAKINDDEARMPSVTFSKRK